MSFFCLLTVATGVNLRGESRRPSASFPQRPFSICFSFSFRRLDWLPRCQSDASLLLSGSSAATDRGTSGYCTPSSCNCRLLRSAVESQSTSFLSPPERILTALNGTNGTFVCKYTRLHVLRGRAFLSTGDQRRRGLGREVGYKTEKKSSAVAYKRVFLII